MVGDPERDGGAGVAMSDGPPVRRDRRAGRVVKTAGPKLRCYIERGPDGEVRQIAIQAAPGFVIDQVMWRPDRRAKRWRCVVSVAKGRKPHPRCASCGKRLNMPVARVYPECA